MQSFRTRSILTYVIYLITKHRLNTLKVDISCPTSLFALDCLQTLFLRPEFQKMAKWRKEMIWISPKPGEFLRSSSTKAEGNSRCIQTHQNSPSFRCVTVYIIGHGTNFPKKFPRKFCRMLLAQVIMINLT